MFFFQVVSCEDWQYDKNLEASKFIKKKIGKMTGKLVPSYKKHVFSYE